MTVESVTAIIEQYAKHDWRLRRALLSPQTQRSLGGFFSAYHPETAIINGADDALWFSRRSLPDREAWELRRLTDSPFALVTVLEDSLTKDEKEALLAETEARMFDGSHAEPTSH